MLPTITTTHAVPSHLPANHIATGTQVKFCERCQTVLNPVVPARGRSKRGPGHRCVDQAAARRPSVSVPFN
jgi:hypothetical protein